MDKENKIQNILIISDKTQKQINNLRKKITERTGIKTNFITVSEKQDRELFSKVLSESIHDQNILLDFDDEEFEYIFKNNLCIDNEILNYSENICSTNIRFDIMIEKLKEEGIDINNCTIGFIGSKKYSIIIESTLNNISKYNYSMIPLFDEDDYCYWDFDVLVIPQYPLFKYDKIEGVKIISFDCSAFYPYCTLIDRDVIMDNIISKLNK